MGHLLYAKENFRKDMKITNTVIFLLQFNEFNILINTFLDFPYSSGKKNYKLQARYLKSISQNIL